MQVYFEYNVELHDPATGISKSLPAGTPLELPQEEAMARIAAGGVQPVDVTAHEAALAEVAPPVEIEPSQPSEPTPAAETPAAETAAPEQE